MCTLAFEPRTLELYDFVTWNPFYGSNIVFICKEEECDELY